MTLNILVGCVVDEVLWHADVTDVECDYMGSFKKILSLIVCQTMRNKLTRNRGEI